MNNKLPEIYIGTDHAGFALKAILVDYLSSLGIKAVDVGTDTFDPLDDYPDFVAPVARAVSEDPKTRKGIVIGGTGQGEAMLANRFPNVICDGRSIASDIFPDCDLAFLVEAGLAVRAFRRWKDLSAAGSVWSFNEVKDSIASRDQTDRYRLSSPYRRTAKHVLVLRSDVLTVQQSVDCIFTHVQVLQFVS